MQVLVLALTAIGLAAITDTLAYAEPTSVTIAGSLQSGLGCPGDWQPECALTHLALDPEDGEWQATFAVPAGSWAYKLPARSGCGFSGETIAGPLALRARRRPSIRSTAGGDP